MVATHKVKDSNNTTVGFIIGGNFYSKHIVKISINDIDNITITKSGTLRCKKELPIISYRSVLLDKYNKLNSRNPFSRDIQKRLLDWKKRNQHKVLQLEGARQIGKTTELLKFGYQNYEYVIYISLTDDEYDFESTITRLGITPLVIDGYCKNANLPSYVDNKNTLLIIDEIQLSSNVYNRIRTINSSLDCDLIVTGSYLGRVIRKEFFKPAGTIGKVTMFPLSFKEFCRVFKADRLLETIDLYGKSDVNEYQKLDKLYNIYRQIGGYPEVVRQFVEYGDIRACGEHIEFLLASFRDESKLYFSSDKEISIFKHIYTESVREMCLEKRGNGGKYIDIVTKIANEDPHQKERVKRSDVLRAVNWLEYSGLLGDLDLCLDGNIRDKVPSRRVYFIDCGIANYVARSAGIEESNREGLLTETFAYGEIYRLYKENYRERLVESEGPSFSTYGNYELDFLLLGIDSTKYGIEVKTNKGDPKSLKVYLDKKFIYRGILAKRTQGGRGEKFDTIPIYTIGERFPYKK